MKMNMEQRRLTVTVGLLVVFFSCITVNIYFPEATVKKTAEEIVDEVRKNAEKDKDKKEKQAAVLPSSRGETFSFVPSAYAQQETTVSSPKIRALKDSLRQRFPQLRPFFEKGNIGEANNGLVQVRDEGSLGLKDKAALRALVKDENGDRDSLYAEVAKALNIDSSQVPRIRKIFAETWIKNAQPGWWIQKEDGAWIKKQ